MDKIEKERIRKRDYMRRRRECAETAAADRVYQRDWRRRPENKERAKIKRDCPEARLRRRNNELKRLYGLTFDDVRRLYDHQGGLCAICGIEMLVPNPSTRKRARQTPCVDHDHVSGKVRELVCDGCNKGLGSFRENVSALRAAADYLEKYQ